MSMEEEIQKEEPKSGEVEAKIATILAERDQAIHDRDEAITSRDTYIIQTEIKKVFEKESVDAESAMKLLLMEYRIELTEEAQLSIKDKEGKTVCNERNKPATIEWVVKSFLGRYPYFAKVSDDSSVSNQESAKQGSMLYLTKPRSQWSEAELQHALAMVGEGKIIIRDGKWVAK